MAKNYFYTMGLLAAAGFYSHVAHAANISFNFLVNSSGMDIYACDAGIYDEGVSGASSNIQASRRDYSSLSFSPIGVQGNTQFGPPPFHTVAYPGGYSTLTTVESKLNNVIENNTDGTGLIFNIASDNYNARYFVDLCVRGPKVPYQAGNYNYSVSDSVTATDLTSVLYLDRADVYATGKVVCDSRTGAPDEWDSTLIRDNLSSAPSPAPLLRLDGAGTTSTFGGIDGPVNGTAVSIFGGAPPLTFGMTGAPVKYCVIRYVFRETSGEQRIWDPSQAKFNINLNISNTAYIP